MLDELIIETESIDTTNLSEQEKVVIDGIESTRFIEFDLTRNIIHFRDKKYDISRNYWDLKNDRFRYNYSKIYEILEDEYPYDEPQINDFVKDVLLKYYKIKVTKTFGSSRIDQLLKYYKNNN